jgi:hypothetical protein
MLRIVMGNFIAARLQGCLYLSGDSSEFRFRFSSFDSKER